MNNLTLITVLILLSLFCISLVFLWFFWQKIKHQQQIIEQDDQKFQKQWEYMLEQQMMVLSQKIDEDLSRYTKDTVDYIGIFRDKLSIFEAQQQQFRDLNHHIIELKNILGNRQARGALGERQLAALVRQLLPNNLYQLQVTLSNNRRADCILQIPYPPGPIVVDAKFPLEGYRAWIKSGGITPTDNDYNNKFNSSIDNSIANTESFRQFRQDVKRHIDNISQRYILSGETADFALMFIPAEAVYAEIHASLTEVIDHAFAKKVFLVSPTTLMTVLNTVRGIVHNIELQKQTHEVGRLVGLINDDVKRLDERTTKLRQHFESLGKDIDLIEITQRSINNRTSKISQLNT